MPDLEFVQFHPTALKHPSMPRPLLSEALRSEGAVLRDNDSKAFMADIHPLADLAPPDVVARAIHGARRRRGAEIWLDDDDRRLPPPLPDDLDGVHPRRPGSRASWLPVAPAAHYMSGGVVTDLDGATSLSRLWACGCVFCAAVYLYGPASPSNSLFDGLSIREARDQRHGRRCFARLLHSTCTSCSVPDPRRKSGPAPSIEKRLTTRPFTVTSGPYALRPTDVGGVGTEAAVELHDRGPDPARLGRPVDHHFLVDRGKQRQQLNGDRASRDDGEDDGVRAGRPVRVEDRLPQRAGARVDRGRDRERRCQRRRRSRSAAAKVAAGQGIPSRALPMPLARRSRGPSPEPTRHIGTRACSSRGVASCNACL